MFAIDVVGWGNTSTGGGRAWAFLDANNVVLNEASANATVNGLVVAPANTAKIVINNSVTSHPNYYAYKKNPATQFGQANYTFKRNNVQLVSEFLTVAQTYLGQTDIEYKDGQTVFWTSSETNGIDCVTFVLLCMLGYPYSETPYATGNYIAVDAWKANTEEYDWAINPTEYKVSRLRNDTSPEMLRLACQLARWMGRRNQVVSMNDGFRDVLPGDIVFWGRKVDNDGTIEWRHPTWFLHINHVGIVLSKEDAPDTFEVDGTTYNWDKAKYPYKHTIIDVGETTPPCRTTHWLEEGQEDTTNVYKNNVNTIALICRPDLGALGGGGTFTYNGDGIVYND